MDLPGFYAIFDIMRSVVLICLDSVRKDIYDHEMTRTKELVDFSADECRAASSWSVPSHASFLSGQLPSQHGIHTDSIDFTKLNKSEIMTSLPFERTISISANQFTGKQFGFDTLFDDCYTLPSSSYYPDGLDMTRTNGAIDHLMQSFKHDNTAKSIGNGLVSMVIKASETLPIKCPFDNGALAIQRLVETSIPESREPYFLFLNFMEAHHPHRPTFGYKDHPEVPNNWSSADIGLMELNRGGEEFSDEQRDYIENFRTLYQASVEYLDRQVSNLIEKVQNISNEEVTFIITADHGENLGYESDDNLFGHTASLSEGLLHVPFDIINPQSEINVDSSKIFSQRRLPRIVEKMFRGETISIPESQYVATELIGSGPLKDADEYWDRMIRSVYNPTTDVKVIWDSEGNTFQEELEKNSPCKFLTKKRVGSVPRWAKKQFDTEITQYKQYSKNNSISSVESLDSGTKGRLEDLGYL